MRLKTVRVEEAEHWQAGHYGATRVALWAGERYLLSAGTADEVYYCTDKDAPSCLYALSLNYGLGYIGLELFDALTDNQSPTEPEYQEAEASIFAQQPEELKDYGLSLLDMSGINAVKWLAEYL